MSGPEHALNDLAGAIAAIDASGVTAAPDVAAALTRLLIVRSLRRRLQFVEAELERRAAAVMTGARVVCGGVVAVRRSGRQWRAWDDRGVINSLLPQLLVDKSTGELGNEAVGRSVALGLLQFARPAWRLGALRSAGLEPDQFAELVPSHRTVTVTGSVDGAFTAAAHPDDDPDQS